LRAVRPEILLNGLQELPGVLRKLYSNGKRL
jgi:hypothetical protein